MKMASGTGTTWRNVNEASATGQTESGWPGWERLRV